MYGSMGGARTYIHLQGTCQNTYAPVICFKRLWGADTRSQRLKTGVGFPRFYEFAWLEGVYSTMFSLNVKVLLCLLNSIYVKVIIYI